MLAPAIRIDPAREADVRAAVAHDDRLGRVIQEDRLRIRQNFALLIHPRIDLHHVRIKIPRQPLKAIRQVPRRTPPRP